MPLPIQKIHTLEKETSDSNFFIDYSLLLNTMPKEKKIVTASDEDAELLIRFWTTADKLSESEEVYRVSNSKLTNEDILRLKAHGFLTGSSEEVKFTSKAKAVITTMALGESNAFTKQQKKKSYTEIIASMSLKGKKGYRIPKFAANSNLIRVI